jgi:hypothetical protein
LKRFYPAKVHGMVDFATCGLWFAGPEVFRMDEWEPGSVYPPKLYGIVVLLNTLGTDFGQKKPLELGGLKLWSMRTHLIVDAIGSSAVILAPWLTGSRRRGWNYWAPHLAAASIVWWSVFSTTLPEEE